MRSLALWVALVCLLLGPATVSHASPVAIPATNERRHLSLDPVMITMVCCTATYDKLYVAQHRYTDLAAAPRSWNTTVLCQPGDIVLATTAVRQSFATHGWDEVETTINEAFARAGAADAYTTEKEQKDATVKLAKTTLTTMEDGNTAYFVIEPETQHRLAARIGVEAVVGHSSGSISEESRYDPFMLSMLYLSAGIAEGYATQASMMSYIANTWDGKEGIGRLVDHVPAIVRFVRTQLAYMKRLARDPHSGAYGKQLRNLLAQLTGLVKGYNARLHDTGGAAELELHMMKLFLINFQAEVPDIANRWLTFDNASFKEKEKVRKSFHAILQRLRCSALVKVTKPDASRNVSGNIFFSHVTWNAYESMIRQYKTYRLEERDSGEKKYVTMSSYPGMIHSVDDWYLTHQRFGVMETTNGIYNSSLYQFVKPESIPEFLRVMLANYLSDDQPQSWIRLYGMHNSGTYSNQWMILRVAEPEAPLDRWIVEQNLPNNTFWVAEQLPMPVPEECKSLEQMGRTFCPVSYGLVASDQTAHLNTKGYWASYNTPFYPCVYEATGTGERCRRDGDIFSWSRTPRAQIFARDQSSVTDLSSMHHIMRYGNYRTDSLSRIPNCTTTGSGRQQCTTSYSAMLTIASRGDLNPPGGPREYGPNFRSLGHRNHGATDVKIGSWRGLLGQRSHGQDKKTSGLHRSFVAHVQNGPTTEDGLPIFRWHSHLFDPMPPTYGLPVEYNFPLVQMETMLPDKETSSSGLDSGNTSSLSHSSNGHRNPKQERAIGCACGTFISFLALVSIAYVGYRGWLAMQEEEEELVNPLLH